MRSQDYADLYALEESLWWFVGMREVTAALLDPACPPGRARDVLDAGCGTGGMLNWLERYARGGRAAGVDLSHDALAFCRERGLRDVTQASVTALPFADASFDLVTSFDVLVQLPGEGSDETAMREMFRVLRPGGVAFVRAAAYEWMRSGHDEALGTQRRYTLDQLAERLERAGFRVSRATYANTLLLPAAALRRLVLKRVGLADSGSDVKPLPPGYEWLNRALASALAAEATLLRRPGAKLPAGLSAICIAEKPPGD
ncbi:MAG TPA: methyltransferase domain-containing protein [Pyrinomonadaceae bacterium]|nr:methyltransferase domain-containing protein [Pyrinomonadaceae bacterium]